jgi:hypothetical protein
VAAVKKKGFVKNCTFQSRFTEEFFFICIKGATVCMICNETVSILKVYGIKGHKKTKHASQVSGIQGQLRKDKIT